MASPTITRDDLAALLQAKDEAQARWLASIRAVQEGASKSLDERISLDLANRAALTASLDADNAYAAALKAFLVQEAEAA